MKKHIVFDTELIGTDTPVFLVCGVCVETGEQFVFWHHKRGHTAKLEKLLLSDEYTWVSFNGNNFDAPLMCAAVMGHDESNLKIIAQSIIEENMRSWQTYREYDIDFIEFDHIDLIEVAPGVMTSLKTYMGRIGYPTMIDLPFDHTKDLTAAEQKILQTYCLNDIGGTVALFQRLRTEIDLRTEMSEEHGIDLRSKSDAQIAEAILKKACSISKRDSVVPRAVRYDVPDFIKTKSAMVQDIIDAFETTEYEINRANGSPIEAEWMKEPVQVGKGFYKVGLGGLHSQHDVCFYAEATDKMLISDFDVASYYPNIMMVAGLIPRFGGDKGQLFLDEYRRIYEARIKAKREGNKRLANTLKIVLNGTFGKLGSIYSAFYSPDLLIAVTITGQINLLCLIAELEAIKGVIVASSNTDGITVTYPPAARDRVLKVFQANAKRTGFEYEETRYAKIAMKDVNNYLAVTSDNVPVIISKGEGIVELKPAGGKVKQKGLYAEMGLMKNPTMEVCTKMVIDYLVEGALPEDSIQNYLDDPMLFMAIRGVTGGGIQHTMVELDDSWTPNSWKTNRKGEEVPESWYHGVTGKTVKRVSKPDPAEIGIGGEPFGRVARWYMTTQQLPAITYVKSGNKVPKTDGAKVCMTLPKKLPKDLDYAWYIEEAKQILAAIGVKDPAVAPMSPM